MAEPFLVKFGEEMKMHVFAVEYPGYGLYQTAVSAD
jgi:hypothetical protein